MKKSADNVANKSPKNAMKTSRAMLPAAEHAAAGDQRNDAVKQGGNHSEPLQKDAVRKAAAAEQTKLQRDPDALPTPGFPTKRDPLSAAKNSEDPVLPSKSRDK
jgi:hypothetical protein